MKRGLTMLIGSGVGAGLMYMYDPQMGRRRRAVARDKIIRAAHKIDDAMDVTSRDLVNRTGGLWAEMGSLFRGEEVSDDILVERVRSELGGAVSHPSSIAVTAQNRRVRLSGPILAHEVTPLLKRVAAVRGVADVENALEVHEAPGNVPGLQGQPGRRLAGQSFDLMQTSWSPTTRLLAGAAGGALAVYGTGRRDLGGAALSFAGLTLLARALTNMELRRMFGMGDGERAVHI
jgi:osmotically-inducible protein OsmY